MSSPLPLQPLSVDAVTAVLLETDVAAPALLQAADALCVPLKVDDEYLGVDVTVVALLSSVTVTLRDCRDSVAADDASDEVLEPF